MVERGASTPKKRGAELLIANLNPVQSHCLSRRGRTGIWAKNCVHGCDAVADVAAE